MISCAQTKTHSRIFWPLWALGWRRATGTGVFHLARVRWERKKCSRWPSSENDAGLQLCLALCLSQSCSPQAKELMVAEQHLSSCRFSRPRLAFLNEVPEKQEMNERRVKALTGGDVITAPVLFKNSEFFRLLCQDVSAMQPHSILECPRPGHGR